MLSPDTMVCRKLPSLHDTKLTRASSSSSTCTQTSQLSLATTIYILTHAHTLKLFHTELFPAHSTTMEQSGGPQGSTSYLSYQLMTSPGTRLMRPMYTHALMEAPPAEAVQRQVCCDRHCWLVPGQGRKCVCMPTMLHSAREIWCSFSVCMVYSCCKRRYSTL